VTSDDDGEGVPDTDPRQLDPAGDLAAAVEAGEFEMSLAADADEEELERFLAQVEAGEFEPDPGLEAVVRIVRALLEEEDA
jgi:hypothetical protein